MNKLQPTNIKDGERVAVMHGECLIVPVDKLPRGGRKKESQCIIGHSETGHHHVLISKQPFEVMPETEKHSLYVRLFEPAEVKHQKTFDIHETQVLAPGGYAVYHKTEYDPFTEVVRRVFD